MNVMEYSSYDGVALADLVKNERCQRKNWTSFCGSSREGQP